MDKCDLSLFSVTKAGRGVVHMSHWLFYFQFQRYQRQDLGVLRKPLKGHRYQETETEMASELRG